MKFTLEIELGNEAMQFYSDITEAVIATNHRIRASSNLMAADRPKTGDGGKIRDLNGNTVGKWEVTDDQPANVTLAGTKRLS